MFLMRKNRCVTFFPFHSERFGSLSLHRMASIVLENINKSYPGPVSAVRNLNLVINDGEFMVLLGPSGCGKTTTLRLIAGLETPDKGCVRIDGIDVTRLAPAKRNVAMIFQDISLYPHLTARKNLTFALKLRKVPRAEIKSRIEQAAQATSITDLLNRRPGEMSGGECQRVALAGAIVREPACLLLDEPLSNLDVAARRSLRATIKTLHQQGGSTMLHVTHDQEEAMSLADRIAIMHRGAIHQIGTPIELYRHPADRFVAGFLGNPPMNFIEGRIQAENGGLHFSDGGGFQIALPPDLECSSDSDRVVLGVRPEHLRTVSSPHEAGASISATITLTEFIGERIDLHARMEGGNELIARIPAESATPSVGENIHLGLDPAQAHYFVPGGTGKRLSD